MPAPLYLKDPGTSRYVAGGLEEVEALLGSPLPDLPPTEKTEDEREVLFVYVHARLRSLLHRYLEALLVQIGVVPASVIVRNETLFCGSRCCKCSCTGCD